MENVPQHIDDLIARILAEEGSAEDKAVLEAWLKVSEENRRYFRSFELLFKGASAGRQRQNFDTDAAWNALRERIRKSPRKIPAAWFERRSFPRYWQAAAALILILVAGYLAVRQQKTEADLEMTLQSGETTRQDTLPDGSRAFLNTSTLLGYRYVASAHQRRLTLEGEAYFEVGPAEDSPFIIECSDVFIEDIGTTFNVRAYPDAATVEVFVETGEVKLYTLVDPGLHLIAGETGMYNRDTREFTKSESPGENILSYKTRVFSFSDRDLRTVVEDLNRAYTTQLTLGNEGLGDCRLNVTFREESIDAIADIIAETLGLTVTRENGAIIFEGKGCAQ